jgi:hypothetical protein
MDEQRRTATNTMPVLGRDDEGGGGALGLAARRPPGSREEAVVLRFKEHGVKGKGLWAWGWDFIGEEALGWRQRRFRGRDNVDALGDEGGGPCGGNRTASAG